MKIFPLYSSSKGNMFCLENNGTSILIDIGVSFKNITSALKGIGKSLDDISAIFITHEHTDHTKGLATLCKNTSIPIYTCVKTKDYLLHELEKEHIDADITGLNYGQTVSIARLDITPFKISHDAIMPCGYFITNGKKSVTFATDLGYVSKRILDYLKKSDYAVLECNYDDIMLEYGKYPYPLKERIRGSLGHLSNECAAKTVSAVLEESPNTKFLLSHLSENNNTPELARSVVVSSLESIGKNPNNIYLASKEISFEEYLI